MGTNLVAQNITKSPYSIFGLGERVYSGNALTWSLGQTTQGIRSPYFVNYQNPASYSATYTTNIEAGAVVGNTTVSSATSSGTASNAWMNYFNLAFPVAAKRGIGLSFGATPVTSVGYQMTTNTTLPQDSAINGIPASYNLYGRGGLSQLYFGGGMRLYRNVSAGLNGRYVFGETRHTTQLLIPASYNMFNTNEDRIHYTSGWVMDFGVQVHDTFSVKHGNGSRDYEWVAGLTFTPESQLSVEEAYLLRSLPIGSATGIRDTIYKASGTKGTAVMPMSWKAGVSFAQKDCWMVSADVSSTQWSRFSSMGSNDSLRNSIGAGFGASWIPDFKSKAYLARVEYRVGARYEQMPLEVNGTRLSAMSLTAGLGLPIARSRSRVNLGVEWMQRGTTSNNLLQEEYLRVFIGISFADRWFYRYRYD